MIPLFSVLVATSILAMVAAFLSAASLETAVKRLEERARTREQADTHHKENPS